MKIVLTGVCGRLGGAAYRDLLAAGHEVVATDRLYRSDLAGPVRVQNLLDREGVYNLMDGAEVLVHLGNYSSAHQTDAQTTFNENVTMNMNVFQAGAELGLKRIIFTSSIQAISGSRKVGDAATRRSCLAYLPGDGGLPCVPGNTYGLSKQSGEQQVAYYCREYGMTGFALRFPHIVSPEHLLRYRQKYSRTIDDMHDRFPADEMFSFIHMDDAASLIAALIEAPVEGMRTYIPASAHNSYSAPIDELLDRFYQGVPLRRPRDEMDRLIDTREITADCGWSPSDEPLVTLADAAT